MYNSQNMNPYRYTYTYVLTDLCYMYNSQNINPY